MMEKHNNPDITVKPAYKGGSIRIMNTVDYTAEAHRQFYNQEHYKTLDKDPTIPYKKYTHHLIDQAWRMEIIGETTKENLQTKNPKIPSFYLLPKTHKPNNPGRPIVNSIGISHREDFSLCRSTPRIPSYVKDTTNFINIIKNIQLEPHDILVTIDVSSPYTNISHTEEIAAINKMMEETGTATPLKMFISNLTYQVLTRNYFNFTDNFLNRNKEQQWAPGWHPTMQSYLCIIWKPTFQQATQHHQKIG